MKFDEPEVSRFESFNQCLGYKGNSFISNTLSCEVQLDVVGNRANGAARN